MLKREWVYYKKIVDKDKKILNSKNRKTSPGKVNLHWWSRESTDNIENVGDYLSVIVCNYMLQKRNLSFDMDIDKTKHLYSIGSIIQGGAQNATVWGSGLKHGEDDIGVLFRYTRKLDVRLVRGPRTREVLLKKGYACPEKYGDPAILMPEIYQPEQKKTKEYVTILHHDTTRNDIDYITPLTADYKSFIDSICQAKKVISSSLHGIILAEAYGIPAVLLTDKATENLFKYEDYYFSTGRYDFPIAESVEEALKVTPLPVPDNKQLIENIKNTFPYDLWE